MFSLLACLACYATVMKCFEKAVPQSGHQLKAVSPVKCAAQFNRQRSGQEKLSARDWFEAMPEETLRYFAMAILVEFGFPTVVQTATEIKGRMEQAS